MPSPSASRYESSARRVDVILTTIQQVGRRSLTDEEIQGGYGAVVVADVAAWNSYVVSVVRNFYAEIADPTNTRFHAVHTIARDIAERMLDRFNTPNAENTRDLLLRCSGYDPWNDWQWTSRGLNGLAVRNRLNEIVKVRHSFAHGFSVPSYSWTQSASGRIRLTVSALRSNQQLLRHLVKVTDRGLKNHLSAYGGARTW